MIDWLSHVRLVQCWCLRSPALLGRILHLTVVLFIFTGGIALPHDAQGIEERVARVEERLESHIKNEITYRHLIGLGLGMLVPVALGGGLFVKTILKNGLAGQHIEIMRIIDAKVLERRAESVGKNELRAVMAEHRAELMGAMNSKFVSQGFCKQEHLATVTALESIGKDLEACKAKLIQIRPGSGESEPHRP